MLQPQNDAARYLITVPKSTMKKKSTRKDLMMRPRLASIVFRYLRICAWPSSTLSDASCARQGWGRGATGGARSCGRHAARLGVRVDALYRLALLGHHRREALEHAAQLREGRLHRAQLLVAVLSRARRPKVLLLLLLRRRSQRAHVDRHLARHRQPATGSTPRGPAVDGAQLGGHHVVVRPSSPRTLEQVRAPRAAAAKGSLRRRGSCSCSDARDAGEPGLLGVEDGLSLLQRRLEPLGAVREVRLQPLQHCLRVRRQLAARWLARRERLDGSSHGRELLLEEGGELCNLGARVVEERRL